MSSAGIPKSRWARIGAPARRSTTLLNLTPRSVEFFNSKVTRARLYPELDKLLERSLRWQRSTGVVRPPRLLEALRGHVFNKMPLRLIQLPQMKLVERSEVVSHIAIQMAGINEALLAAMEAKVDALGKEAFHASGNGGVDLEEDDAREDIWGAICEFLFQKFARYAILSHTWLQTDREIVYQDARQDEWPTSMGLGKPNTKAGCEKLKGFCDVAYTEHGVSLAWIDTLCINKDSSAELDESIQSMYKWYQNSSICITYLRDTTSLDNMKSDNWFRRGWTLQELVAPKRMQFYKSDWTRLTPSTNRNDKEDPAIQEIIHKVTGVPPMELLSFDPLTGSDIATRMSWAASRTTTRGEDRAYSLMGIFGVNFPISYGEGPERAFFRLIEAIISSRHISHIMQALNWAGKSISDTIHTSRLIPSRPECYSIGAIGTTSPDNTSNTPKTSTFFPTHSKPMFLTHLGLRVRLLLISTDLVDLDKRYSAQKYGPFDMNITLKFPPSTFEVITELLEKRYSEVPPNNRYPTRKATPFGSSFFLGIYTFKEENHEGHIQIPLTSFAFILNIPNPYNGFTIHDLTADHFEPTTKVDTRSVVQVRRIRNNSSATQSITSGSEPFYIFKKKDLAARGMKLLNVYL